MYEITETGIFVPSSHCLIFEKYISVEFIYHSTWIVDELKGDVYYWDYVFLFFQQCWHLGTSE